MKRKVALKTKKVTIKTWLKKRHDSKKVTNEKRHEKIVALKKKNKK